MRQMAISIDVHGEKELPCHFPSGLGRGKVTLRRRAFSRGQYEENEVRNLELTSFLSNLENSIKREGAMHFLPSCPRLSTKLGDTIFRQPKFAS